ncbi:MAG TPA: hypothetical protein VF626_01415, partial [Chthoniobacterales bacterium]
TLFYCFGWPFEFFYAALFDRDALVRYQSSFSNAIAAIERRRDEMQHSVLESPRKLAYWVRGT